MKIINTLNRKAIFYLNDAKIVVKPKETIEVEITANELSISLIGLARFFVKNPNETFDLSPSKLYFIEIKKQGFSMSFIPALFPIIRFFSKKENHTIDIYFYLFSFMTLLIMGLAGFSYSLPKVQLMEIEKTNI